MSSKCSSGASVNTFKLVSLILTHTLILCSLCCSSKVYNVHWNTTNPIFRIDNTDHIIDVNRDNLPYDQVNIICPVYAPGTREEDAEKYIIYNVSKEEYDTCRITNPNPRIIAVCDKPYKLMYFTITFRSFTPQPGGLEFRPGQDYYFISTSSRDDLHRRVGGRCSTHNMKVVFKVCCHPGETPAQSTTGPPVAQQPSVPRLTSSSTTMTTTSTSRRPVIVYTSSSTTTTSTTILPPIHTTRYPPKKTYNNNPNVKPTSKKKEMEKHPNEVVKNEELTSSAKVVNWNPRLCVFLLLVITIRNPFWRLT
ncbi:unnamed protein product [Allacma fusca]|uniref:Ephrin RBD domain-containing protein n=1 Tax=Allacma fusca TaxID=39272 RepID=A0A8J2P7F9_9HEXA|nr:unnamed protein product [Allacma fusca]